jgi:hypothetical protein
MVLEAINRNCAVIRSLGGKCAVMTERQSGFTFQSKEAFIQWMANKFIPSLEEKDEKNAVGPWWWHHKNRRQYDGVIFKPLAPKVVPTSDGQFLLNMYLGWGVKPKQGDWSLIRNHIREVLANGDKESDDYIIRWIAWRSFWRRLTIRPRVGMTSCAPRITYLHREMSGRPQAARLMVA